MPRSLSVLLLLCSLCVLSAQAQVLRGYAYARQVTVELPRHAAYRLGDEVGVAELLTFEVDPGPGLGSSSGSFVRVTDSQGTARPSTVLSAGPGHRMTVAWQLSGDTTYWIHFGGPPTPARAQPSTAPTAGFGPARDWWPKRGLLVESWAFAGGGMDELEQTRATFVEAARQPVQGAGFVDTPFLGHNPFGPSVGYCHRYTGYLVLPSDGDYFFALASDEASHVFLNDELLIEWPGVHGWDTQVHKGVTRTLRRSVAKLTILHVNAVGDGGLSLAWKLPDAPQLSPIPPASFLPVARARLGALVAPRGPVASIDIQWRGETVFGTDDAGELFSQRLRFDAELPATWRDAPLTWAVEGLGTRLVAQGQSFETVFLAPGDYQVRLSAGGKIGQTISTTLHVDRAWEYVTQASRDRERPHVHAALLAPSLAGRGSAELARAMQLFKSAGSVPGVQQAAALLFGARQDALSAESVRLAVPLWLEFANTPEDSATIAGALLRSRARAGDANVEAMLVTPAARLIIEPIGQARSAIELLAALLNNNALTGERTREIRTALGDAYRALGDRDRAAEHYRQAGGEAEPAGGTLRAAGFARTLEDFVRRGELDAADRVYAEWMAEFPADRLDGWATLLNIRRLAARGRIDAALREADALVAIAPAGPHTPTALVFKVQLLHQKGDIVAAVRLADEIIAKYPGTELATQAKQLREQIATQERTRPPQ